MAEQRHVLLICMWFGEEAVINSGKLSSFLKYSAFFIALGLILGPAGTVLGDTQVISLTADWDDVEENSAGDIYYNSSDLELVYDGSNQTVGLRFNGVNVPPGSTISSAYITVSMRRY